MVRTDDNQPDDTGGPRDAVLIWGALAVSAIYATLRYNVFKDVAWADWPHYVGNKVLAVASLVLVTVSAWRLVRPRGRRIGSLMAAASALAIAHTLLSLALLEPAYYDKFFTGARFTLAAGTSLSLGALATALLLWGKGKRGRSAPGEAIGPLSLLALLSAVHAALPSLAGWFDPATWPGGMPPLTLLSFLLGLAAVAAWLRASQDGVSLSLKADLTGDPGIADHEQQRA